MFKVIYCKTNILSCDLWLYNIIQYIWHGFYELPKIFCIYCIYNKCISVFVVPSCKCS